MFCLYCNETSELQLEIRILMCYALCMHTHNNVLKKYILLQISTTHTQKLNWILTCYIIAKKLFLIYLKNTYNLMQTDATAKYYTLMSHI